MERSERKQQEFVARQNFAAILTPLRVCLVALLLACVLKAGPHNKKQSELAPNLVGDTSKTFSGTLVRFAGIPGFTYTIQNSNDGTNWTTVNSMVAPANGLMNFLDSTPLTEPLFYRTVVSVR